MKILFYFNMIFVATFCSLSYLYLFSIISALNQWIFYFISIWFVLLHLVYYHIYIYSAEFPPKSAQKWWKRSADLILVSDVILSFSVVDAANVTERWCVTRCSCSNGCFMCFCWMAAPNSKPKWQNIVDRYSGMLFWLRLWRNIL